MQLNKKTVFLLTATVLLLAVASPAAAQTMKIGIFDSQRVSEESAEGKRAAGTLEAKRDAKQQELNEMEQAVTDLQAQLNQQALSLSIERRTALEIEIQRKGMGLTNERDLATRELQLDIATAEAGFNEKLRAVLSQFGRDNGFTVILEANSVAWSTATIDVTTIIIDKFDQMFPPTP